MMLCVLLVDVCVCVCVVSLLMMMLLLLLPVEGLLALVRSGAPAAEDAHAGLHLPDAVPPILNLTGLGWAGLG